MATIIPIFIDVVVLNNKKPHDNVTIHRLAEYSNMES